VRWKPLNVFSIIVVVVPVIIIAVAIGFRERST
jgi:hypothetical protein